MQTFETTIATMERRTGTPSGNPRYRITVDKAGFGCFVFASRDDCMDSLAWVPEQLIGKPVVITLDDRMRVFGIDPVADMFANSPI